MFIALQTPQKQDKKVTPKNTPQKKEEEEEEEYGGSTDVDEKGLLQSTDDAPINHCH